MDVFHEKRQKQLKHVKEIENEDYTPNYLNKGKRTTEMEELTRQKMDEFKLNKYMEAQACNMNRVSPGLNPGLRGAERAGPGPHQPVATGLSRIKSDVGVLRGNQHPNQ